MEVFKILMMYRAIPSNLETVRAYNIIDIVFSDSKDVRGQWAIYLKGLDEKIYVAETSLKAKYKLLELMAKDLGYKDAINWESIQSPYVPIWLNEELDKNRKFSDGQLILADLLKNIDPQKLVLSALNLIKTPETTEQETSQSKEENQ